MRLVCICLVLRVRREREILRQVSESQDCIFCCMQTLSESLKVEKILFHMIVCMAKNWRDLSSQDFICKHESHSQTYHIFESDFLLLVS